MHVTAQELKKNPPKVHEKQMERKRRKKKQNKMIDANVSQNHSNNIVFCMELTRIEIQLLSLHP